MDRKSFITGVVIAVAVVMLTAFTPGKGNWRYGAVIRNNEIFIIDTSNGRLKQATKGESMQLNENFDVMTSVPSKLKRGINQY